MENISEIRNDILIESLHNYAAAIGFHITNGAEKLSDEIFSLYYIKTTLFGDFFLTITKTYDVINVAIEHNYYGKVECVVKKLIVKNADDLNFLLSRSIAYQST